MVKNFQIKKIQAKEILDSNNRPTVEVGLETELGKFWASVPSGVSTGKYEAKELRDEDGGVKKAIENIEKIIAPVLVKEDLTGQERVDEILIDLDGTKNKSRLGANAILAVSIACCRAIAASRNLPLYKYLSQLMEIGYPSSLPRPSFNMIEGGKHAENGLAFQEFMVIPQRDSFKENLAVGQKIYKKLKDVLEKRFKKINMSAEGAFSPTNIRMFEEVLPLVFPVDLFEVLNLIMEGSQNEAVQIAIDAAASSFYRDGLYNNVSKEKLTTIYQNIIMRYPIISIEDPFYEEDFNSFVGLGDRIIIFGDDLTASNVDRIKMAKEKNACNGLILKPNQVGTVTETIEAAKLAKSYGWKIMVANRGGETEDDFIADLAVGIGAEFIKSGAPFPKERMAKYNRLVRIEEELK